jgi:hypothetical protein
MKTKKPIIKPVNEAGDSCNVRIEGLSVAQITKRLGFKPNVQDDPYKVKNSWGFTVDGVRCGVWDYKGSEKYNAFSAFGPDEALRKVFGEYVQ